VATLHSTGQVWIGHDEPLQATSHAHDAPHSIDEQAFAPEQLAAHCALPHRISPHAAAPVQVTVQRDACAQSMAPQPPLLHLTVQAKPAGHWTSPHGWAALHSTLQAMVVRSQDVHGAGQVPLSRSTQ